MKVMSKSRIIDKSLSLNIMKERDILAKLNGDFIINIFCSFQDFSNLYLVLQLMSGGDLRYHLNFFYEQYTERMIKFLIVNICICLKYIHQNGIIHRDIKPENFLFDDNGYLYLTDFGLAIYEEENVTDSEFDINNNEKETHINENVVGTLGYIAPEILLGKSIDYSKGDIYSFGVICYELIFKKRPYKGKMGHEIEKEMLINNIDYEFNDKYSDNLITFVKGLLELDKKKRLGTKSGINDIIENEYIKDYHWDDIQNKVFISPFSEIIEYLRENNEFNKERYELFDSINCNFTLKLDYDTNMRLAQIEANPNFIYYFMDYEYINLGNEDITSLLDNNNDNLPKIRKRTRRIIRSNSSSSYNIKNDLKLPIINQVYPKYLKNIYKYKLIKYQKILNKIDGKKDDKYTYKNTHKHSKNKEKKKEKEKEKEKEREKEREKEKEKEKRHRKHRRHRRYSYDDSETSYHNKPFIVNNFYSSKENKEYIPNPYYINPFASVQNNFILPKINPFLRGFNGVYEEINKNINNGGYSKCSSSDTYEKIKKDHKHKKSKEKKTKENISQRQSKFKRINLKGYTIKASKREGVYKLVEKNHTKSSKNMTTNSDIAIKKNNKKKEKTKSSSKGKSTTNENNEEDEEDEDDDDENNGLTIIQENSEEEKGTSSTKKNEEKSENENEESEKDDENGNEENEDGENEGTEKDENESDDESKKESENEEGKNEDSENEGNEDENEDDND